MKRKFVLLLSLFVAVVVLGTALAALASSTSTGGVVSIQLPNPLALNGCKAGQSDLECLTDKVTKYLLILAFPAATLGLLIGGFRLMFAGGNVEKIEQAWTWMRYVIYGFLVILLATVIVTIVQDIFTAVTGGSPGGGTPSSSNQYPSPLTCPGSAGCPECSSANPPAYCQVNCPGAAGCPECSGANPPAYCSNPSPLPCSNTNPTGVCSAGQTCSPNAAGDYVCQSNSGACNDAHPTGSCPAGQTCANPFGTGFSCITSPSASAACDNAHTNGTCDGQPGTSCKRLSDGDYHCAFSDGGDWLGNGCSAAKPHGLCLYGKTCQPFVNGSYACL